jgi:hypothetical protein
MHALGATELEQLKLERTEEGVFLSSVLQLNLAPAVESALERAVPIYFVMQADVFRERWYWADRKVVSTSRTYRLAYQPLTRRWRVSVSSGAGPATGLQYALHQNFETLNQAVASIARVSHWRVAEAERLEGDAVHHLNYQFKLDLALLPRPFQLGMNAQPEWHIDVRRSLPVPLWVPVPASLPIDASGGHSTLPNTSAEGDKAIVITPR